VRETLFNWLGQDLPGWHCLDLFAGSGALGFEAASRGAERVVMIERDRAALEALEKNRAVLGASQVSILRADALAWLANDRESFDLIFVDPPFDSGLAEGVLADLAVHLKPAARPMSSRARKCRRPPGLSSTAAGARGARTLRF
jgi:16S rRNA (guanine966-N2)-methyltransferase